MFSLNKDGSAYTELYSFSGFDGAYPSASLAEASDGSLYGTTQAGGDSYFGTVFRLKKDGSGFAMLHSFTASDGAYLSSSLVEASDGSLYGTALGGGDRDYGTVFRLNKDGTGFTPLLSFDRAGGDGSYPNASLVQASDGRLYGTTQQGGDINYGTVFWLKSDGGGYTLLHSFSGADGVYPNASLIEARDGRLYGTTVGAKSNISVGIHR